MSEEKTKIVELTRKQRRELNSLAIAIADISILTFLGRQLTSTVSLAGYGLLK